MSGLSIKSRIEIDNREAKVALKDVKDAAKKAGAESQNGFNKASKGMQALSQGINTVARQVNSTSASITSMLGKMGPAGMAVAAVFTAIAGAIAVALKTMNSFANKVFEARKRAASIGIDEKNINEYRALEYAAAKTGIEMDKLEKIIGKLEFAFGKASDGEKKMIDAFHALGLSWEELSNMSPAEQLLKVADAYNKMTENGSKVKPEFFNIFGKRDLQTFNKMKESKFGEEFANLGAFGFDLTPEQVEQTKMLVGSYEDAKKLLEQMQGIIAVNSGMTEKWVKFLNKLNKPGPKAGRVTGTASKFYEGIEDVGLDIIKNNSASLTREQKQQLLRASTYENMSFFEKLNGQPMMDAMQQIGSMSEEQLQKAVDNIDFTNMGKQLQRVVWEIAEAANPEDFSIADPNKWKRKKKVEEKVLTPEQIAKENVEGEARRLIKESESMALAYEGASRKADKLVSANKEIARLTEKLRKESGDNTAELDKQLQEQLKLNLAKQNQLAIENDIRNLQKQRVSMENGMIGNIISKAGGPSQDVMAKVLGRIEDFGNEMFGEDFNFKEDFMKRVMKEYNSITGNNTNLSTREMLAQNPNAMKKAFNEASAFYFKDFKAPTREELANRPDLAGLDEATKAERIEKIQMLFEDLDAFIKGTEDALKTVKSFEYSMELEKLQNSQDMYKAQISGDRDRLDRVRLQQLKESRGVTPNDLDANRQAERVYQMEKENRLLKERASLSKDNDVAALENQIQAAKLRGNFDEAKQLQKTLELRKRELDTVKDLAAFEKELADQERNRQDAAKNTVAEQIRNKKDASLKEVYNLVGQGNKFEEDQFVDLTKRQLNLEQLPEDFEDLLRRFSRLSNDVPDFLKAFKANAKPQADIIQTNELARRGGFAESVVVEKRDNTDRMVELMKNSEKLISTIKETANKIDNKLKVHQ